MAKFTVAESKEAGCRSLELDYDFGTDLDNAVEKFGADVVFSGFVADGKVAVQSLARRLMRSMIQDGESQRPYTDAEITAKVAEYKLGIRTDRGAADPLAKLEKTIGKMTDAQKAEFLAKLQALAAA